MVEKFTRRFQWSNYGGTHAFSVNFLWKKCNSVGSFFSIMLSCHFVVEKKSSYWSWNKTIESLLCHIFEDFTNFCRKFQTFPVFWRLGEGSNNSIYLCLFFTSLKLHWFLKFAFASTTINYILFHQFLDSALCNIKLTLLNSFLSFFKFFHPCFDHFYSLFPQSHYFKACKYILCQAKATDYKHQRVPFRRFFRTMRYFLTRNVTPPLKHKALRYYKIWKQQNFFPCDVFRFRETNKLLPKNRDTCVLHSFWLYEIFRNTKTALQKFCLPDRKEVSTISSVLTPICSSPKVSLPTNGECHIIPESLEASRYTEKARWLTYRNCDTVRQKHCEIFVDDLSVTRLSRRTNEQHRQWSVVNLFRNFVHNCS